MSGHVLAIKSCAVAADAVVSEEEEEEEEEDDDEDSEAEEEEGWAPSARGRSKAAAAPATKARRGDRPAATAPKPARKQAKRSSPAAAPKRAPLKENVPLPKAVGGSIASPAIKRRPPLLPAPSGSGIGSEPRSLAPRPLPGLGESMHGGNIFQTSV